jgi:hypothetical protein
MLYLILTDPESTIEEVVQELGDLVRFVDTVYASTGVAPVLSFNLAMLPLTGTPFTSTYPHDELSLPVGTDVIYWPSEFRFDPAVARFLRSCDARTALLPNPRENLDALPAFLAAADEVLRRRGRIKDRCWRDAIAAALQQFDDLCAMLDKDVDRTADILLRGYGTGHPAAPADPVEQVMADPRHLGGYYRGMDRLRSVLVRALEM